MYQDVFFMAFSLMIGVCRDLADWSFDPSVSAASGLLHEIFIFGLFYIFEFFIKLHPLALLIFVVRFACKGIDLPRSAGSAVSGVASRSPQELVVTDHHMRPDGQMLNHPRFDWRWRLLLHVISSPIFPVCIYTVNLSNKRQTVSKRQIFRS